MTDDDQHMHRLLGLLKEKTEKASIVGYFGYGSLVNEQTLRTAYIASTPAELDGWHRVWDIPNDVDFGAQTVSLLTARPDPSATIAGSIIFDDAANLPDVDERERNYHRHKLSLDDLKLSDKLLAGLHNMNCEIYVYEAHRNDAANELNRPPILQSYLDAVLQGFYQIYGEQGVYDFIHTTKNFDTPILRDRDAPKYPRSIDLSPSERNLIDYILTSRQDITFI